MILRYSTQKSEVKKTKKSPLKNQLVIYIILNYGRHIKAKRDH